MSTPTDVVPEAGWYRDPASPGVARWWDGSSWGSQTQAVPTEVALPAEPEPVPPAPEPVAVEAAPLIGVAAATLTPEPSGKPSKGRSSKLSMPDVNLSRKPILIGIAAVVVAGGAWYAWSSMHSSSSSDAGVVRPTPSAAAPGAHLATLQVPKTLPAKLVGEARQAGAASLLAAKRVAAAQRPAGSPRVAAYYGPSATNRFLFIGSTLTAAQAKPVSLNVERTQLVGLLNAETGSSLKAAKVTVERVSSGRDLGTGQISCVTATTHGKPASVCSWQHGRSRFTVVSHSPMLGTLTTLRKAIVQLGH